MIITNQQQPIINQQQQQPIINQQQQPIINQQQPQQQQIFNNNNNNNNNIIQPTMQQMQLQSHTNSNNIVKVDQPTQNQTQQVVVNPNILKFVELPKVQPNQQLFSLNTITNEITQLNPNQTTAALGPMERLLIVPSGINAQQLAQCLSQGQIHFNNIGQVAPTTDPNKIQQQIQIQQQQQQQIQNKTQQIIYKQPAKIAKEPKSKDEPKVKKARGKKAKLLEEQQKKLNQEKDNVIMQQSATKLFTPVTSIENKSMNPTIIVTSANMNNNKNTITISPNPTLVMNHNHLTSNQITNNQKAIKLNNCPKLSTKQNSISVIPAAGMMKTIANVSAGVGKINKNQSILVNLPSTSTNICNCFHHSSCWNHRYRILFGTQFRTII